MCEKAVISGEKQRACDATNSDTLQRRPATLGCGAWLELQRALSLVCRSTAHGAALYIFHRDLIPPLENPYNTLSAIIAVLRVVTQLVVVALLVCLLGIFAWRTHAFSTALPSSSSQLRLHPLCCFRFHSRVTKRHSWWEEVACPVALPFGAAVAVAIRPGVV